jgi:hypothetical protein
MPEIQRLFLWDKRSQFISQLELALPMRLDYVTWPIRRDIHQELNKAEK